MRSSKSILTKPNHMVTEQTYAFNYGDVRWDNIDIKVMIFLLIFYSVRSYKINSSMAMIEKVSISSFIYDKGYLSSILLALSYDKVQSITIPNPDITMSDWKF